MVSNRLNLRKHLVSNINLHPYTQVCRLSTPGSAMEQACSRHEPTEQEVAAAIKHVKEDFALVGIANRYGESTRRLRSLLDADTKFKEDDILGRNHRKPQRTAQLEQKVGIPRNRGLL